jgi:multiple sugar transport system permease protein
MSRSLRWRLLLGLLVLLVGIWSLFPFLWYFLVSLTLPGSIPRSLALPSTLTLRTYAAVLLGGGYVDVGTKLSIVPNVVNSVKVAGMTVALCLVLSVGAAYVYSRFRSRALRVAFNGLLVVRMTPGVSLAVPIFLMMTQYRLVNTHLGLALVHTLLSLPLAIWLMKGFFDTIPPELEEAAAIDGASLLGALRRIVLPLAAPGVAVTACFVFLASYVEFMFALILSRGGINTLPLAIAGYKSEHQVFYNEMAAASFISMIPLALFFFFVGRSMVSGLSLGALK